MYQGIDLYVTDRSAEAVPLLLQWAQKHPDDEGITRIELQAEASAAFDARRYQDMYAASVKVRDKYPADHGAMLAVASAAACMYVVTTEEHYRQEALDIIGGVRGNLSADESAAAEDLIRRTVYRLDNREIIDPEEYYRRFPEQDRSTR